jgi:hypothetical protein
MLGHRLVQARTARKFPENREFNRESLKIGTAALKPGYVFRCLL